MTYEEAIDILVSRLSCAEYCNSDYVDSIETEAVALAIKALQKQVPMKPIVTFFEGKVNICPKCSRIITINERCECGQRLDWSDEK